jgi:nanoRNase/pAp phosphatase (c-di-AMP/oligoRNAs hydrolase)
MYSGFRPPRSVLTALITGILYDTKFFRLATRETFDKVSWLIKMGGDYLLAQKLLLGREVTRSEKIAVLKGLSRTGLYQLNRKWILAITCVGAYESSVLKELIDSGADIAIAIAHKKNKIRVTARASRSFISAAQRPVAAELCSYLGKTLGGEGGGHSGAAGVTIPVSHRIEEILDVINKYFQSFLGLKMIPLEAGRWMDECE